MDVEFKKELKKLLKKFVKFEDIDFERLVDIIYSEISDMILDEEEHCRWCGAPIQNTRLSLKKWKTDIYSVFCSRSCLYSYLEHVL